MKGSMTLITPDCGCQKGEIFSPGHFIALRRYAKEADCPIAVTTCLDTEYKIDGWRNTSHFTRYHGYYKLRQQRNVQCRLHFWCRQSYAKLSIFIQYMNIYSFHESCLVSTRITLSTKIEDLIWNKRADSKTITVWPMLCCMSFILGCGLVSVRK